MPGRRTNGSTRAVVDGATWRARREGHMAATVRGAIRELMEQTMATMDALLEASDRELLVSSSHACAQGKDVWTLITNDIDHEKIHTGQILEGRYESRITASPMQRLVASGSQNGRGSLVHSSALLTSSSTARRPPVSGPTGSWPSTCSRWNRIRLRRSPRTRRRGRAADSLPIRMVAPTGRERTYIIQVRDLITPLTPQVLCSSLVATGVGTRGWSIDTTAARV
jgi:hypothetical protein